MNQQDIHEELRSVVTFARASRLQQEKFIRVALVRDLGRGELREAWYWFDSGWHADR